MRTANANERKIDFLYDVKCGMLHCMVLRIARRSVNKFAKSVISRAYERGLINSFVMHEMTAIIDRSLWPDRELAHSDNNTIS